MDFQIFLSASKCLLKIEGAVVQATILAKSPTYITTYSYFFIIYFKQTRFEAKLRYEPP